MTAPRDPVRAGGLACLALLAALAAASLAGCAGGGPLGNGLGEVVGEITVDDGKGGKCVVRLVNGKDQTGLELKGLKICGAELAELHADKSDGAAAAIAANEAVSNHAIDVGGGLANAGIGLAAKAAGLPVAPPVSPQAAAVGPPLQARE